MSRFISKLLRHEPEIIGCKLEHYGGWLDVDKLIDGIKGCSDFEIDRDILEQIVANDPKGRYSFSSDGTKIRANQGHSVDVVIDMEKPEPPEFLYHGTAAKFLERINEQGILPQRRNFVHLSPDRATAVTVGYRHSKPDAPVILRVHAAQMSADGYELMISDNGVWQTKIVPPKYFESMGAEETE